MYDAPESLMGNNMNNSENKHFTSYINKSALSLPHGIWTACPVKSEQSEDILPGKWDYSIGAFLARNKIKNTLRALRSLRETK